MKIYKLEFDVDTYDNLISNKEFTVEELQSFDGRSHIDSWTPVEVSRLSPDKNLKLGDAPGFIIPVFSKKAINALIPLIKDNVEILPLIFSEEELFAINVTTVLDVIDHEKSEYVTFTNSNRIMVFKKYSFKKEIVTKASIFKIPDESRRLPFVSEEFKKVVCDNNLEGFKFVEVWDSEKDN